MAQPQGSEVWVVRVRALWRWPRCRWDTFGTVGGQADFGDDIPHRSHRVTVDIPEPLSQCVLAQALTFQDVSEQWPCSIKSFPGKYGLGLKPATSSVIWKL